MENLPHSFLYKGTFSFCFHCAFLPYTILFVYFLTAGKRKQSKAKYKKEASFPDLHLPGEDTRTGKSESDTADSEKVKRKRGESVGKCEGSSCPVLGLDLFHLFLLFSLKRALLSGYFYHKEGKVR